MACTCPKGDDAISTKSEENTDNKDKNAEQSMEKEPSPRDFLHLVEETYRILPMFQHILTHHKPVLDLEKNEFLAKQWDKFLDNPSPEYVRIRLFKDMEEPVSLARRFSLNGKSYYNRVQKLVPVPVDQKRKDCRKVNKYTCTAQRNPQ